jgi:hypothetical protein
MSAGRCDVSTNVLNLNCIKSCNDAKCRNLVEESVAIMLRVPIYREAEELALGQVYNFDDWRQRIV